MEPVYLFDCNQLSRKLAEQLLSQLEVAPAYVEKVEIAGPGFLNFYLSKQCLQQAVLDILQQGAHFGSSQWGNGRSLQLEFVSANPTGPLNIVSARAAAIGDVLANCYNLAGFAAQREFYVNDAGRQIRLLGQSLSARYMNELGSDQTYSRRRLSRTLPARPGPRDHSKRGQPLCSNAGSRSESRCSAPRRWNIC